MKRAYLWQGVLAGFIVLAALALFLTLFLIFGGETTQDLHRLIQAVPLAAAFLGSCVAGAKRRTKGLLSGIAVSFWLWLILAAILCWFLPRIMGTWVFLLFLRMLVAGVLGGLCGVNMPRKPKAAG